MTKFFKKSKKNLFLGPFWAIFAQIWTKNDFFWKNELGQFLNIPIIYHCAKNQKKLTSHSREKCQTDGWTDRQTDGQTENSDFIGPFVGQGAIIKVTLRGPIIKVTLSFLEFISTHQKPVYPINFFVRYSPF